MRFVATAQSLGPLVKSAHVIVRNDWGSDGNRLLPRNA